MSGQDESATTSLDGGEYRVDWNDYDGDRDVTFALVGAPGTSAVIPPLGALVRMYDADGNRCLGLAERFDNGVLAIRCLWETWRESARLDLCVSAPRSGAVRAGHTTEGDTDA